MPPSFEKKPSDPTARIADSGKIVTGAGLRLPTTPSHVADRGKIGFGAGLRLPALREPA
jgi:hypothetical protein